MNHLESVRQSEPNGVMYRDEFLNVDFGLIPTGGNNTAHAPALIETADGGMLCAWFAGSFEGSGDISIVVSKLDSTTQTWSVPVTVSEGENRSEQNPSFFRAPDNKIWLIYTSQVSRQEGKDNMQFTSIIMVQKSSDEGKTWGKSEVLFENAGTFGRQGIQILSNGRWIYSTWLCEDSAEGLTNDPTEFQISDNAGKTWHSVRMPDSNGRVHANVVEVEPGHLVAFMRSRFADFVYSSESFDFGDSWCVPQATVLPNNNASVSAIKLATGEIALAYNMNSAPNAIFGQVAWPGLRNPVAVSVSEDFGKTWPIGRIFEMAEGYIGSENKTNNSQHEYPTLYQDSLGRLNLVYAYKNRLCVKYVRFTVADLFGEKREAMGVYNPTSGQGVEK
ncbi:putative neuraminidase [Enterococcus sp. PF1-24]|uniref:sialidase family protein n=1 Tax=unclassified Enterococcus TaxID=2608891 RepID=UPI002475A974|nr:MULTISPECIES: sialidase family protein [unclassified Enterococcus]MDH6363673.1 putative neuraminidase [Enterococcus sp. PFB1-1]MDH6400629.1 putative neuraminidase [Enterococcus sp. PF1-24]